MFGDVEYVEGVTLFDETFEGEFVELILQMLLVHHGVELAVECGGVCGSDTFYAQTFSKGVLWLACLAYFGDGTVMVNDDFHLLFTEFMAYECEYVFFGCLAYFLDDDGVIEQVRVEE